MNPAPPQTSLNTSADAIVIGLKAGAALVGLTAENITLSSDDGKFSLRVPASAFPHLHPEPGEVVIVSLTLMLNRIEAVDPFQVGLLGSKAQ